MEWYGKIALVFTILVFAVVWMSVQTSQGESHDRQEVQRVVVQVGPGGAGGHAR